MKDIGRGYWRGREKEVGGGGRSGREKNKIDRV